MFGRKSGGDVKKSALKVLDPKKELVTRLKHLRVVLDCYDTQEAKGYFDLNYSHIYYIFHEAFTTVEGELKQRANRQHREELDYVLFLFEKILTLLPELIHKRWQYHSIGRLMKKLLHSGNSLKLRKEGMRLFLLWYQILMDNATDECHKTYASLVPRLGGGGTEEIYDQDIFTARQEGTVSAVEIAPILPPQSGEKQPDNLTKWMLESLLNFMVTEIGKIEWSGKEMREFSFSFLFNKFKEYYLLHIFPEFNNATNIYDPNLDLPKSRRLVDVVPSRTQVVALCQDVVVKWLATFMYSSNKKQHSDNNEMSLTSIQPGEKQPVELPDNPPGGTSVDLNSEVKGDQHIPGSNQSTLSTASSYTEKDSQSDSASSEEYSSEYEFVKGILFKSRENVNIIHEIYRQAFLFPFHHAGAIKRAINVYKEWFDDKFEADRPVFMLEPVSDLHSSVSLPLSGMHDTVDARPPKSESSPDMSGGRAHSYLKAVGRAENNHVKAGMQNVLQIFITNSANVFLLEPEDSSVLLDEQVDMCKRVLNIYRHMVMNHHLEQKTWEQLLKVLLKITSGVLKPTPPANKDRSLEGKLAPPLFQTLIVTWIKANLNVYISEVLWDDFLTVLSSLTAWVELVREWAKTMEILTRVLARQVYSLDLTDLPLDRLSEQKKKRKAGNMRPMSQDMSTAAIRRRTFSRGWSRHETKIDATRQRFKDRHKSSPVAMPGGSNANEASLPTKKAQSTDVLPPMLGSSNGSGVGGVNGFSLAESGSRRTRSRSGETTSPPGKATPRLTASEVLTSDSASPGPIGGPLIRSNSDSSLMIAIDNKGANEDDETGSLAEEVLGFYMDDSHSLASTNTEATSLQNLPSLSLQPISTADSVYLSTTDSVYLDSKDHDTLSQASGDTEAVFDDESVRSEVSEIDSGCDSARSSAIHGSIATKKSVNTARDELDNIGILRKTPLDRNQNRKMSDLTQVDGGMGMEVNKKSPKELLAERRIVRGRTVSFCDDVDSDSGELMDNHHKKLEKQRSKSEDRDGTLRRSVSAGEIVDSPVIIVVTNNYIVEDEVFVGGKSVSKDGVASAHRSKELFVSSEAAGPSSDGRFFPPSPNNTSLTSLSDVESPNFPPPFKNLDNLSTSTGNSRNSKTSYSDRSDTEMLIKLSDGSQFETNVEANVELNVPYDKERLSPDTSKDTSLDKDRVEKDTSLEYMRLNDQDPDKDSLGEGDVSSISSHRDQGSFKDSPTPDRQSLRIDEVEEHRLHSTPEAAKPVTTSEGGDLGQSILAGGHLMGWTPDVAVVLWRRMLGAMGNVNTIASPAIHAQVYDAFCDILDTLIKMRVNLGVTSDNLSTPETPELLPPTWVLSAWCFECLGLPSKYKCGRLLAYRLLCVTATQKPDLELSDQQMARFYHALHHAIAKEEDQDYTNVIVKHCGAKFFALPLPSNTMMLMDFITACSTIVMDTELKDAPRTEAVSMLGSLLCFPEHLGPGTIPVLDPNADNLTVMQATPAYMLDQIVSLVLKACKKEPLVSARCVAISSLGVFLAHSLVHDPNHPKIRDAINVLMSTLKVNKTVAWVACDMLVLLVDFLPVLLAVAPDLPRRIVETIANTVQYLLPATEHSHSMDDKRLLVAIMLCVLEWCMRVPVEMLLDTQDGAQTSLLYKVFRVLNHVVLGSQGQLTPRGSVVWQDFNSLPVDECDNVKVTFDESSTSKSPSDTHREHARHRRSSLTSEIPPASNDILKLAGRTVISHLVNHLGHFPMGAGAARLYSAVQEHHDIAEVSIDDMRKEIFDAPNVQFFVVDNQTVMSFVEIPALTDLPGGGVTAGLTTGKTMTRVIVRDLAGRFCWDSSVLYGPPKCRAGSYPAAPQSLLQIVEGIDLIGASSADSQGTGGTSPAVTVGESGPLDSARSATSSEDYMMFCAARKPSELPVAENTREGMDNLDDLLRHIGHTSPECQLYTGEPLNIPYRPPDELPTLTQDDAMVTLLHEGDDESVHFSEHTNDDATMAWPMEPTDDRDPESPFHLCRLFLNQMGHMQWGKRRQIDLLQKSDKLLRELKHLDNHKCRETHKIAVIYVAPGQEDKQSVLMNKAGSKSYEDFVSALGWEVDLETHPGFMGGLQRNKTTGESMPYYATSTTEAIFHVSTRMPSDTAEDRHVKLRHLGNDEVQIIWSEHQRDYRRGIIPTEFGDALIIIYPLPSGLFRIHINRKPEVPYFGPLFDGAIVPVVLLPGLVRATALNASYALRTQKPFFMTFFEERARNMESLVQNNKQLTTFEDFSAQVFAPVLPQGGDLVGPDLSLATIASGDDFVDGKHSGTGAAGVADRHSPQGSRSKGGKEPGGNGSAGGDAAVPPKMQRRLSFGKNKKSVTRSMQSAALKAAETAVMGLVSTTPPGSPRMGAALVSGRK